jgi:hypothetical protein
MSDELLHCIRYSKKSFPPYRFIPGQNPHPTENPQGHSFGVSSGKVVDIDPHLWFVNETYLFGVDLYNHGYWWEAHESWEILWKQSKKDYVTRNFFQGLIKVSGAMLKWYQNKPVGVELLYSGGIEHLKETCHEYETFMGVDLMRHIAKLHEHFIVVISQPEDKTNFYKLYPYLELEGRL